MNFPFTRKTGPVRLEKKMSFMERHPNLLFYVAGAGVMCTVFIAGMLVGQMDPFTNGVMA